MKEERLQIFFLLTLASMVGLWAGVEYSGWVLALGLLGMAGS